MRLSPLSAPDGKGTGMQSSSAVADTEEEQRSGQDRPERCREPGAVGTCGRVDGGVCAASGRRGYAGSESSPRRCQARGDEDATTTAGAALAPWVEVQRQDCLESTSSTLVGQDQVAAAGAADRFSRVRRGHLGSGGTGRAADYTDSHASAAVADGARGRSLTSTARRLA